MAITINRATLARQINGEIEYIYPKTYADLVEYDSTQSIKEKIDSITDDRNDDLKTKLNKPVNDNGSINDGIAGQVLETNGDGTTSWVTRSKVYVGSDEMPEGYDVKIDPNKINIDIDKSLTIDGAAADAKSTGDAINSLSKSVNAISNENENIKESIISIGESINTLNTDLQDTNETIEELAKKIGNGISDDLDNRIKKLEEDSQQNNNTIKSVSENVNLIAETSRKNETNIDNLVEEVDNKVDKPLDENGVLHDGKPGQVLETNGDGTTSWVTRPRVYVGDGEMPEGYDVHIDPTKVNTEIDKTLTIEGHAADAKATGVAIDNLKTDINNKLSGDLNVKLDKPLNKDGEITNGESGQVLETNGDGTTTWANYTKVYVGSGEMPEGYDVQIDPDATVFELDRTLSIDGAIAESKAVGTAINLVKDKINNDVKTHNEDPVSHIDIRAMITEPKDYILMRDTVTGEEVKVSVENGKLVVDPAVIKVTKIEVVTNPTKTTYEVKETFNPSGMVVKATYNDGDVKEVTNYTYNIAPLTANTSSVSITYIEGGITVTAEVPVTVVVRCIGIHVTTPPMTTQYYIGDKFNTTGMIVAATYTDDTVVAITNYTYSDTELTAGTTMVQLTYVEDGTTFTTNALITVIPKYTSLSISTNPTKIEYTVGDVFDPAGMVVKANYNDGSSKVISNYSYGTSTLTKDMTYITISYTENGITNTVNVNITVKPAFDPNTDLIDFTYITNADGTYTITSWKGTLNGVPSTEIFVPDSDKIILNPVSTSAY